MIAKIPPKRRDSKSSFKALVDYCLGVTGHSKDSVVHTGFQNIYALSNAVMEMEDIASCNTRCIDPAFHFILSWREMESPTHEQVDEAVAIALKELDLQECQSVWALQTDTENLHVHVAVNRIHPETFAAVRPAGGWTKKALERAARKIEMVQGWTIENSGRYQVDTNGTISEKTDVPERKLSAKAADMEAHTGRESLESIAKREIAPILKSARTWEELHREIARHGFVIEKRGKGAVLRSGETAVKLSTVSRECSISKLEKRIGEYRERSADIEVRTTGYKENISVRSEEELKVSFERYSEERREYLEEKKKAFTELKEQHKQELKELRERQKQERAELFKENWRGRGMELNMLRSLMAFASKKEHLELKEAQKREREKLKKDYPASFPSFKRWLTEQEDDELFRTYRYKKVQNGVPAVPVSLSSPARIVTVMEPVSDLRGYTAKRGGNSRILYCRDGKFTADFEDVGRTILLDRRRIDEMSVLSAMQLAAQKWGAVQITGGNAQYKELCVALAVKHGIKLANADLAAEVERRRETLRSTGRTVQNRSSQTAKLPQSQEQRDAKKKEVVTEEDIKALNITDNARIYLNPRTDNQRYKGEIVHVDAERGFCVQKIGNKALFVHRLDKFKTAPEAGKSISIYYPKGADRAEFEAMEISSRRREVRR